MSSLIEIIDPEGERRRSRQRKILFLASLLSLALFAYPEVQAFRPKWDAYKTGRGLALYLSMIKTKAIAKRVPLEVKLIRPDRIEVYEVGSCGPNARREKLWETSLKEQGSGSDSVVFAEPKLVQAHEDPAISSEPVLQRFCYDPLYGSSVFADGLEHGSVFLIHHLDEKNQNSEALVQLHIRGASADLSL